jgi:hypothetical protein
MRVFEALLCVMVALLVTAASGESLHSQDGVSQDVHAAHGGESLAAAVQSNLARGSLVRGSRVMLATDTQSKQAQTAKGLISLRAASRGTAFTACFFSNSGCGSGQECSVFVCQCAAVTCTYGAATTNCCDGWFCDWANICTPGTN